MNNPFQYGAALKPSQMLNRRQEIRDVTRALLEHGRLFLLGPRRHGKTEILHAVCAAAARQGAIVLSLDAESYAGFDDLVQGIVAQAARLLKSDVARTGEKILAFFSHLRPVIAYNPANGEWSASINIAAKSDQLPLFIQALDGVARLAKHADKPVAVVIDEFQKLIEWGGEGAEGQIRSALQRHGEVGFVFAGSKTSLLNDMTLNPARPFYRMGVRHFLGPLPREGTSPLHYSRIRGRRLPGRPESRGKRSRSVRRRSLQRAGALERRLGHAARSCWHWPHRCRGKAGA